MKPDKIATLKRLMGDASDMKNHFDLIIYDHSLTEETVDFYLRKIVHKCDYISNELEKEFKK